jgi:hypothetical protein
VPDQPAPDQRPTDRPAGSRAIRLVSAVVIAVGLLLAVTGAVGYAQVSSTVTAERIVVSDDARCLDGEPVSGPFAAYCQADALDRHGNSGTTTDSVTRSLLHSYVVAFAVAVLAIVVGLAIALIGVTLLRLAGRR